MVGYGFKFDADLLDNAYLDNRFEMIEDLLNALCDKKSVPYERYISSWMFQITSLNKLMM